MNKLVLIFHMFKIHIILIHPLFFAILLDKSRVEKPLLSVLLNDCTSIVSSKIRQAMHNTLTMPALGSCSPSEAATIISGTAGRRLDLHAPMGVNRIGGLILVWKFDKVWNEVMFS